MNDDKQGLPLGNVEGIRSIVVKEHIVVCVPGATFGGEFRFLLDREAAERLGKILNAGADILREGERLRALWK